MKRNNFYILLLMCLINISLFSQGTWTWQNPLPQGNNIYDIHSFDATTAVFVGDAGNIYKTTNGGTSWMSQTSGTSYSLKSVYFVGANTGWAVGENGIIIKTINGGTSWTSQTSGTTFILNAIHFTDVNTGSVVGENGTILKTTNGGTNWNSQTSPTAQSLYSVDFTNENIGWIVGGNGSILKTTNGGANWISQTSQTTQWLYSVDFIDANTGWAVGGNGKILKTTDGGAMWYSSQTGGSDLYSVHFFNAYNGWAVGNYGEIYTTLNGISWTAQSSGTTDHLYSINFVDVLTGWAVGGYGAIMKTTDGGENWTAQTSGTGYSLNSVDFVDENNGWAVGDYGAVVNTTNGGTNWTYRQNISTFFFYSVDFIDGNTGWAVGYPNTIMKTTNGGINWTSQSNGTGTTQFFFSVHFVDAITGWVVGDGGAIFKTTNGGTNWSSQSSGTILELEAINFVDGNNGWVVGSGGIILRTQNGGVNWIAQSSGSMNNLYSVHFIDANTGWAVGYSGTILKTTNGGTNWSLQTSGTTTQLNSVHFVDSNRGWTIGNGGTILTTSNGGTNWSSQSSRTIFGLASVKFINNSAGWVVGFNGTILKFTNNPNAYINLTSPNGGENWLVGSSKSISWSSTAVANVKLEYSTNNGTNWFSISNSVPANPPSYNWVIPNTPSPNCKVKISDAINPGTFDISDDLFTISSPISDSIFISVNELDAAAGDTVILNVDVRLPPNSSFISAEINFDGFGNDLQFFEIDTTGTLAGRAKWIYYTNFQDSVLYTAFAGSDSIIGSGVLFKLKFVVPANSGAGFIPINFNYAIFNTGSVFVHASSGGVNIIAPHYGDVDLNDIVQAYDAATILQYLANMITLNQQQKLNADVTLDNTISAYDASVILQYVVHIIDTLPHTSVSIAAGELKMPDGAFLPSGFVEVPLNLTNGNNIYSFEAEIHFDSEILQYQSIEFSTALSGFVKQSNNVANSLIIVGASTSPGITAGNYAKIKFSLKPNVSAEDTKIILSKLRLNENAVVTNSDTALISTINNIPGDVSLPAEYSLAQNYPNPFNPATTIKYQLPEASHVTLKIFNVMGELVQILIDEEKPAGYHRVEFDAGRLSSGIYFYRINAGSYKDVKKMILAK